MRVASGGEKPHRRQPMVPPFVAPELAGTRAPDQLPQSCVVSRVRSRKRGAGPKCKSCARRSPSVRVRVENSTARQCVCAVFGAGPGVPSDQLATGIKKTVSRFNLSADARIGEPGASAPHAAESVSGTKNIR